MNRKCSRLVRAHRRGRSRRCDRGGRVGRLEVGLPKTPAEILGGERAVFAGLVGVADGKHFEMHSIADFAGEDGGVFDGRRCGDGPGRSFHDSVRGLRGRGRRGWRDGRPRIPAPPLSGTLPPEFLGVEIVLAVSVSGTDSRTAAQAREPPTQITSRTLRDFSFSMDDDGAHCKLICRGPGWDFGFVMRKMAAIIARPSGVKIGECPWMISRGTCMIQ